MEQGYMDSIIAEWKHYIQMFPERPIIRELHLGGGTPTFFSPENLRYLIEALMEHATIHPDHEFSFEGHPNNTTKEHLAALFAVGFRRVSYGIQDLNEKVQTTINRVQPLENVINATKWAREIGYESINFDLVYGLPFQTVASVADTIEKTLALKPDRIAFYSYAHVPWLRPGQRAYTEVDLPDDDYKRKLYEKGKQLLSEKGYRDIGMDHFSLEGDALYIAAQNKSLHRNFMGYTTTGTELLLGLGASSISDAKYAYAQNEKKVEDYKEAVAKQGIATFKGHWMTDSDLHTKKAILDVACKGVLDLSNNKIQIKEAQWVQLYAMQKEGIVTLNNKLLQLTKSGMAFLRNVCSVFDARMQVGKKGDKIFSKSI